MNSMDKDEYNRLYNELLKRIEITFTYSHSAVTAIITVCTINGGILGLTSSNNFNMTWQLLLVQAILFACSLLALVPMAAKYGDNMKQIASVAWYIRIFYEGPSMLYNTLDADYKESSTGKKVMYQWETTNDILSTINVERPESKLSKLFTYDFAVWGLIPLLGYIGIIIALLCWQHAEWYFVLLLIGGIILFAVLLIAWIIAIRSTSIRLRVIKYSHECRSVYFERAVALGLYNEADVDDIKDLYDIHNSESEEQHKNSLIKELIKRNDGR